MLGGGKDKPAWTACPPGGGGKITRVGGKISRDSLPPGVQANGGWLAPRGASCPGGKINWDTGTSAALWGHIVGQIPALKLCYSMSPASTEILRFPVYKQCMYSQ